jgi:transposase
MFDFHVGSMMLKLYIYGYLNRVPSSRRVVVGRQVVYDLHGC